MRYISVSVVKPLTIIAVGLVIGTLEGRGVAQAASLSANDIVNNWSSQIDPVRGFTNASWAVAPNGQITNDSYNINTPNPSFARWLSGSLISDFSSSGDFNFSGSFFMRNDNDGVGVFFGYQDVGHHYRLSWDGIGNCFQIGCGNDIVPSEGYNDLSLVGLNLVRQDGSSTTVLAHLDIRWDVDLTYDYQVTRLGNTLLMSISQGQQNIFSTSIIDTTFMSGGVGFRTVDQEVFFSNTQFTASIPEPLTVLGTGLAIAFGTFFKREYSNKRSGFKD